MYITVKQINIKIFKKKNFFFFKIFLKHLVKMIIKFYPSISECL